MKNLPSNSIAINKTIKGFFDLFLKKVLVRTKKQIYLKNKEAYKNLEFSILQYYYLLTTYNI